MRITPESVALNEKLRSMYVDQGLNTREIGEIVNLHADTVRGRLVGLGVKLRKPTGCLKEDYAIAGAMLALGKFSMRHIAEISKVNLINLYKVRNKLVRRGILKFVGKI
jgi:hypothetical protein